MTITHSDTRQSKRDSAFPDRPVKRHGPCLIMRGCLQAVFVAALAVTACGAPGPGKTVEQFYRAVESGRVDAATDMLSIADAEMAAIASAKLAAAFERERARFAEAGGIESIEVLSEEIDGNRATVNVRMIFGNGAEDEEGHDLVQVDGRWKISID